MDSTRLRGHLRFAVFLERLLFFSSFYFELTGRLSRESIFIHKTAKICLQNFLLLAGQLRLSPLDRRSLVFAGQEANYSCVIENNRKICAVLAIQLADDSPLYGLFAKTRELFDDLSLAEMNSNLLAAFKPKFAEAGVLGQPTPRQAKPFHLVLDLDETLIHFEEKDGKAKINVRPHLIEFLEETSKLFDLHVFTSSLKEYADMVIKVFDPDDRFFKRRLYRPDTSLYQGESIKDLEKTGFDLKKTILIDNVPENFSKQKSNGILIPAFYSDPSDDQLKELLPLLRLLGEKMPDDVRVFLDDYKQRLVDQIKQGSVTLTLSQLTKY